MSDYIPAFVNGVVDWSHQVRDGAVQAYGDVGKQLTEVGEKLEPLSSFGHKVATDTKHGLFSLWTSTSSAVSSISTAVGLPTEPSALFKSHANPPPPPPSFAGSIWQSVVENQSTLMLVAAGATAALAGYCLYSGRMPWELVRQTPTRTKALMTPRGERKQVVVIIGEPSDPLTAATAWDLNIRGYMVYVTAATSQDAELLARENSGDIRPLPAAEHAASHLERVLTLPVSSSVLPNAPPYQLQLAAIIIMPSMDYPDGPLETQSSSLPSKSIQKHLSTPLAFLSTGGITLARRHRAHIVFVSPAITMAMNPAFKAVESLCSNAVSSLALSLDRELRSAKVPVVELRLGSFNFTGIDGRPHLASRSNVERNVRASLLSWSEELRKTYGHAYEKVLCMFEGGSDGSGRGGERINKFFNKLQYTIAAENPSRIVYAGRHARLYTGIGQWVPEVLLTQLCKASKDS